jgi:hypothetical protein
MTKRSTPPTRAPRSRGSAAPAGTLGAILADPERDAGSGARPVVAVREQEEPEYLAAVEEREVARVALTRRGSWHGEWAELDPASTTVRAGDAPAMRWHAARPIVLHGIAARELPAFADRIGEARALPDRLEEKGGLRRFLAACSAELEPAFQVLPGRAKLFDPERDLERVEIASVAPLGRGRKVDDLWVKSAWLSTFEDDASMRLRFAFGRERDDDASGDLLRHRLVADLGARVLPECALVAANPELAGAVERLIGERPLFTQPIAYWNAVEGGALFHHDAFQEDEEAARGPGQLGVCYLQLAGRTAWLALSIADLAARVRELAEGFLAGELPWVHAQLFPDAAARARLAELAEDEALLAEELAKPACGSLCGLVNRGPEFTAWLADAGHAAILAPGDAILLPNHGLSRTAMHSVFCAGDDTAYGLSFAIRADRVLEPSPSS